MMRLLNIVLPPLPIFLAGKWLQGLINIALCFLLWLPAVFHSWGVTTKHREEKLIRRLKE